MDTPSTTGAATIPISHTYDLREASLVSTGVILIAALAAAGLAALGFVRSGAAPRPAFLGDPDSTILESKVHLARNSPGAKLALVGDSSCLINFDASILGTVTGLDTVNLGTLSYLGLDSFGTLAGEFARTKAAPRIVLAIHPDALRMTEPSAIHGAVLASALGQGEAAGIQTSDSLATWLGFDAVRQRVTDRWVPTPLKGAFGARYGFTTVLREELLRRNGTMDETAHYDPKAASASAEYRLAPRLEAECRVFRSRLPEGCRLRVIVTPVPQSHALKSHEERARTMQRQLESWLGAETPGLDLPSVLPDAEFGTVTHLTPEAARRYSQRVAESLHQNWP